MFYSVYKITNKVNGHYYIGKHSAKTMDEIYNDGYSGSSKLLPSAYKKYGEDNFEKEILGIYSSQNLMDYVESILVVPQWDDPDSYNLRKGGLGGFDFINKMGLNGITNTKKAWETRRRNGNNFQKESSKQKRRDSWKKKFENGYVHHQTLKDQNGKKNPSYRHDITTEMVQELYDRGMEISDIAKELKCDGRLIHRRLKSLGYNS